MTTDSRTLRPLLPAEPHASPGIASPTASTSTEAKRRQIAVACTACQKRKSKCDGGRPQCTLCSAKGTACVYDAAHNETRLDALKRKNEALLDQVKDLYVLYEYLKNGTEEEAFEVVRRLRSGQSVDGTVRLIKESLLLLPPANINAAAAAGRSVAQTLLPNP